MGESLVLGVFLGGFLLILSAGLWLLVVLTGGPGEDDLDDPDDGAVY